MAVVAYGLNEPILLCYAQFTTALPAWAAKNGGQVLVQDGLAQLNIEEPIVANITSFEQNRESLQKVAATCPLRASLMLVPASKTSASTPCEADHFDITEEQGEGLVFACRHAEGGVCAGHMATE